MRSPTSAWAALSGDRKNSTRRDAPPDSSCGAARHAEDRDRIAEALVGDKQVDVATATSPAVKYENLGLHRLAEPVRAFHCQHIGHPGKLPARAGVRHPAAPSSARASGGRLVAQVDVDGHARSDCRLEDVGLLSGIRASGVPTAAALSSAASRASVSRQSSASCQTVLRLAGAARRAACHTPPRQHWLHALGRGRRARV